MAFEWKDIGSMIGNVAPIVGTALGGSAGAAVGNLIANMLGVDNTPDAVSAAIKADPNIVVRLKEIEFQAHKLDVESKDKARQDELESIRMQLNDISGARTRQVQHEQVTGKSDINLYVLAWVVVVGFFILVGTLVFVKLPETNNEIVFVLFGTLSAGFGAVMQYFFGSSKSSADKTVQLHNLVQKGL